MFVNNKISNMSLTCILRLSESVIKGITGVKKEVNPHSEIFIDYVVYYVNNGTY